MRHRRSILAAVAALALLAACTPGGAPEPDATPAGDSVYPLTVDNCGERVTFDAPPVSVLTVGTSALWNLHTAGAGDRVIARTGEFGAPLGNDELTEYFADVPVIDPSDPTAEAITGTGAQLVVGYGFFNTSKEALAELDIETLENLSDCGHDAAASPDRFTIDLVFEDILRFGAVFDTSDEASIAVEALRAELSDLESQRPDTASTAVILYYFFGQLGSHGGTNVSADILSRAGMVGVFADQESLFLNPSLESIIDSDPDWLIVSYGVEGETFEEAREAILAEPGLADLRAVQQGNIVGVFNDGLNPTPGAIDGVRILIEAQQGADS